jgi:hypothetical protein
LRERALVASPRVAALGNEESKPHADEVASLGQCQHVIDELRLMSPATKAFEERA